MKNSNENQALNNVKKVENVTSNIGNAVLWGGAWIFVILAMGRGHLGMDLIRGVIGLLGLNFIVTLILTIQNN